MPLVVPRLEAHPNERVRDGTIFVDGAPKSIPRRLPLGVAEDWHWVRAVAVECHSQHQIPGVPQNKAGADRFRRELGAQTCWRGLPRVLREMQTIAVARGVPAQDRGSKDDGTRAG